MLEKMMKIVVETIENEINEVKAEISAAATVEWMQKNYDYGICCLVVCYDQWDNNDVYFNRNGYFMVWVFIYPWLGNRN